MTSLVHELQQEALDSKVKVSDLLRKALVVSKKLGISEIEAWINKELNGYEEGGDAPDYRMAHGQVMVDDPRSGMIPVVFKDPNKEEFLSKMPFITTAAYLEHLYGDDSPGSTVLMSYNPQSVRKFMGGLSSRVPPVLQVQSSEVYRVLDTIRNTILNWALKLEEDGILGDGMAFSKEEKETATGVSYNINNFFGHVAHSQIQQGSQHSSQSQENLGVDIGSLLAFIEDIRGSMPDGGLGSEQIEELKGDLDTLSAQAKSPRPKLAILKESLLSIQRILEGAAGGAIVQYLPQITAFLDALNA